MLIYFLVFTLDFYIYPLNLHPELPAGSQMSVAEERVNGITGRTVLCLPAIRHTIEFRRVKARKTLKKFKRKRTG